MKRFLALLICGLCILAAAAQTDSAGIKLLRYKDMLNNGLITPAEYELLLKQLPGITVARTLVAGIDTGALADSLMFKKGVDDAKDYFRTGGVFGSTLAVTAVGSPVLGLIPAMIYTFIPPKEKNLIYPDSNLWTNIAYQRGYMKEARKERRASAWKAWGIGVAIDCLAGAAVEIVLSTRNKK